MKVFVILKPWEDGDSNLQLDFYGVAQSIEHARGLLSVDITDLFFGTSKEFMTKHQWTFHPDGEKYVVQECEMDTLT